MMFQMRRDGYRFSVVAFGKVSAQFIQFCACRYAFVENAENVAFNTDGAVIHISYEFRLE